MGELVASTEEGCYFSGNSLITATQHCYINNMVVFLENKTKGLKTSSERTFPKVLFNHIMLRIY